MILDWSLLMTPADAPRAPAPPPPAATAPPAPGPAAAAVTPPPPRPHMGNKTTPPGKSVIWHLADITGQVWQSADKSFLERWMVGRNETIMNAQAGLDRRPMPRLFTAPAPGYGYCPPAGN